MPETTNQPPGGELKRIVAAAESVVRDAGRQGHINGRPVIVRDEAGCELACVTPSEIDCLREALAAWNRRAEGVVGGSESPSKLKPAGAPGSYQRGYDNGWNAGLSAQSERIAALEKRADRYMAAVGHYYVNCHGSVKTIPKHDDPRTAEFRLAADMLRAALTQDQESGR